MANSGYVLSTSDFAFVDNIWEKKTVCQPVANFVQIWSIQEFFCMETVLRDVPTLNSSPPKYCSQGFEYWWKEEAKINV